MKMCFVTPDMLGPIKNGGVGTATSHLAGLCKELEHDVTILFTSYQSSYKDLDRWIDVYSSLDIEVHSLDVVQSPISRMNFWPENREAKISYLVYEYLRVRDFDVVFFVDWLGHLYCSGIAKRAGTALAGTQLVTLCHGTQLWALEGSDAPITSVHELATIWLERQSIALSDSVVTFNAYMEEWLRTRLFDVSDKVTQLQYFYDPQSQISKTLQNAVVSSSPTLEQRTLLDGNDRTAMAALDPAGAPPSGYELTFFGRLETRKGLPLFCYALDRLARSTRAGELALRKVNFLGKVGTVDNIDAYSFLLERSKKWPFPLEIITNLSQPEAVEFLRKSNSIVVVPSQSDNSPLVIIESLRNELCVAVANAGGMPELFASEFQATHVFKPHPKPLVECVINLVESGQPVPRPRLSLDEIRTLWQDYLGSVPQRTSTGERQALTSVDASREPRVTVVLLHRNRPKFLRQALRGLRSQEVSQFGLIVIDDGSDEPKTLLALPDLEREINEMGGSLLRLDDLWIGAARNEAVRGISSEFIFFIDDDNVPMPNMISSALREVEATGSDIVTCCSLHFKGTQFPGLLDCHAVQLPLGNAQPATSLYNYVGDANFMVRRSTYEALNGFQEDFMVGCEDWDFLNRASGGGFSIYPSPVPTYFKRDSADSAVARARQRAGNVRSMLSARPLITGPSAADAINLLHGWHYEEEEEQRRHLWYVNKNPVFFHLAKSLQRSIGSVDSTEAERALCAYNAGQFRSCWRAAPDFARLLGLRAEQIDELDFAAGRMTETEKLVSTGAHGTGEKLRTVVANWSAPASRLAACVRKMLSLIVLPATEDLHSVECSLSDFLPFIKDGSVAEMPIRLTMAAAVAALLRGESWLGLALAGQAFEHMDSLYMWAYGDVVESVRTGWISCGTEHYVKYGKSEGRWLDDPKVLERIPMEVRQYLGLQLSLALDSIFCSDTPPQKPAKQLDLNFSRSLPNALVLADDVGFLWASARVTEQAGVLTREPGGDSRPDFATQSHGWASATMPDSFRSLVGIENVTRGGWSGPRWTKVAQALAASRDGT